MYNENVIMDRYNFPTKKEENAVVSVDLFIYANKFFFRTVNEREIFKFMHLN